MLKFFNLSLLLLVTSVLVGQEIDHPSQKYSEDSEIDVENFLIKTHEQDNVAFFVDDEFIGNQLISPALNPDKIKSLDVEKDTFTINDVRFNGKIKIIYKDDYQPEFISIKDLILEQTDIDAPIVIQIDEEVLNLDYATAKMDKNHILKLILQEITTSQKDQTIVLAKFITKTPANIAEANKITIK